MRARTVSPNDRDQPPDQAALHDDGDDADEAEEVAVRVRVVAEATGGEEREERGHDREADDEEEVRRHDDAKQPAASMAEDLDDRCVFVRLGAMFLRQALREG